MKQRIHIRIVNQSVYGHNRLWYVTKETFNKNVYCIYIVVLYKRIVFSRVSYTKTLSCVAFS
jgi:hypothetical protein